MTSKEWRKKVDEILKGKVNEALKSFQVQREKDFEEIIKLDEEKHNFEVKLTVARSIQEKESKNFIPSNRVLNEQAQKIQYCERNVRAFQKQFGVLFAKLTTIDKSIETNFPLFLKLIELSGKNGKEQKEKIS